MVSARKVWRKRRSGQNQGGTYVGVAEVTAEEAAEVALLAAELYRSSIHHKVSRPSFGGRRGLEFEPHSRGARGSATVGSGRGRRTGGGRGNASRGGAV
jgi:hypothetical protein